MSRRIWDLTVDATFRTISHQVEAPPQMAQPSTRPGSASETDGGGAGDHRWSWHEHSGHADFLRERIDGRVGQ